MVRLKVLATWTHEVPLRSFNSKMVRLKGSYRSNNYASIRSFNSKMVRLKDEFGNIHGRMSKSFNSKMVRLKVTLINPTEHGQDKFQFQNGAIKRWGQYTAAIRFGRFQFQNGAIKSISFHPKKWQIFRFQFQNGAIKRRHWLLNNYWLTSFNSKMVRLKDTHSMTLTNDQKVSIPKWCD